MSNQRGDRLFGLPGSKPTVRSRFGVTDSGSESGESGTIIGGQVFVLVFAVEKAILSGILDIRCIGFSRDDRGVGFTALPAEKSDCCTVSG